MVATTVNSIFVYILSFFNTLKARATNSFENKLVKCDAWYLVLLAVLMTLAFTIYAGLMIWCVVYKGKSFTGNWQWSTSGVSISAECK